MPEPRRELEQRFETALVSVLTLDHDLEMRHADALERRSATAAELSFSYQHRSATSRAKAIVTVEGLTNFACVMDVDFASQVQRGLLEVVLLDAQAQRAALQKARDKGVPCVDEGLANVQRYFHLAFRQPSA